MVGTFVNELVHLQAAQANPTAFAAIYDHYFPQIYNYVRYRVRHTQVAEDLTAQIFERALTKLRSYRPETAPFAVWLFTIARNAVTDHLRTRRSILYSIDDLEEHPARQPSLDEVAAQSAIHQSLFRALDQLGDRERDLLALKFVAQLTNRRIAELTEISESNVAVILYRTLRRLRAELGKEFEEEMEA